MGSEIVLEGSEDAPWPRAGAPGCGLARRGRQLRPSARRRGVLGEAAEPPTGTLRTPCHAAAPSGNGRAAAAPPGSGSCQEPLATGGLPAGGTGRHGCHPELHGVYKPLRDTAVPLWGQASLSSQQEHFTQGKQTIFLLEAVSVILKPPAGSNAVLCVAGTWRAVGAQGSSVGHRTSQQHGHPCLI